MARYIGPKIKISRRFGIKLGLRTNEEAAGRRPFRPGQHGPQGRRGRPSEYSLQLAEKQKAKFIYGVLERQFHNYYLKASKSQDVGLVLLQLLETRLDTVVYKSGFGLTQNQARQFVTHGHVKVDGKKVSIPSFQAVRGMKVEIEAPLLKAIEESGTGRQETPSWLQVSKNVSEVLALPTREQIPSIVNEQLIVEFYSR